MGGHLVSKGCRTQQPVRIEEGMVSDGFRNSSNLQASQEDQPLTDADRGKIEQNLRESATRRNQNPGKGQAS